MSENMSEVSDDVEPTTDIKLNPSPPPDIKLVDLSPTPSPLPPSSSPPTPSKKAATPSPPPPTNKAATKKSKKANRRNRRSSESTEPYWIREMENWKANKKQGDKVVLNGENLSSSDHFYLDWDQSEAFGNKVDPSMMSVTDRYRHMAG